MNSGMGQGYRPDPPTPESVPTASRASGRDLRPGPQAATSGSRASGRRLVARWDERPRVGRRLAGTLLRPDVVAGPGGRLHLTEPAGRAALDDVRVGVGRAEPRRPGPG